MLLSQQLPMTQVNQGSQPFIIYQLHGQDSSLHNVSRRGTQDDALLIDFRPTKEGGQVEPHRPSSTTTNRRPQPTKVIPV